MSNDPAGRSPPKSPSQVFRSRVLDEGIESIEQLVAMYNATIVREERQEIYKWMSRCADWFDSKGTRHLDAGIAIEFASLARIKPLSQRDEDLTTRVFKYLFRRARDGHYRDYRDMEALTLAMEMFDEETFRARTELLVDLVDGLLEKLDPDKNMFSKETHTMDSLMLAATHHALLLIGRVSSGELNPARPLFQSLRARLDDILRSPLYFPTRFQVKLVEQGLHRLANDCRVGVRGLSRQALTLVTGCAYLYGGVRRLVVADVDIDSLEKGLARIAEASGSGKRKEEGWYSLLRELKDAALLSMHLPRKHDAFVRALGFLMDCQEKLKGENCKLLQFGIVLQLRDLALSDHVTETRAQAVAGLAAFTNRCGRNDWQDCSSEVFEAILGAVHALHAGDAHRSLTRPLLEMMCEIDLRRFEVKHISTLSGDVNAA